METLESPNRYLIYSTTALAIVIGLFYVYAKYKLSYWSRCGVKTPPTHIIFGNFKEPIMLRKSPAELLRDIYESADPDDPYIGFYIFHKPMLLIRDHDLIKQVLVKHFNTFPNRRFGSTTETDPLGLRNLLSAKQPLWKYLRAKLTPAMSVRKLKSMMPIMMQCTEPMLKYIDGLPADKDNWKQAQDTLDILPRYMSNVLASLMYGFEENSFKPEDSGFFEAALKFFRGVTRGIVFIIYFFIPGLIPVIEPFSSWPVRVFRAYFKESVKYREKMGNKRGDLVDFLIALKNGEQNPAFRFEGDNLLAQAASFHAAGFETTGTAAAWAIFELARYPEHQQTLYEEIKEYLSGKEITIEAINEMPFLDCIGNEVMRLHPPLPIIDRIAERDFEVPETGLVIEKGVSIYVSINSINQDPKYFSDSSAFIPMRQKKGNKKFYETLTFGVGPRACLGPKLGMIMVKMAIIALVANYSFVCEEKKENTKKVAVHVFKYAVDGLNVKFKKREQKL